VATGVASVNWSGRARKRTAAEHPAPDADAFTRRETFCRPRKLL